MLLRATTTCCILKYICMYVYVHAHDLRLPHTPQGSVHAGRSAPPVDVVPTFKTTNGRLLLLLSRGEVGMLRIQDAERLQVTSQKLQLAWAAGLRCSRLSPSPPEPAGCMHEVHPVLRRSVQSAAECLTVRRIRHGMSSRCCCRPCMLTGRCLW